MWLTIDGFAFSCFQGILEGQRRLRCGPQVEFTPPQYIEVESYNPQTLNTSNRVATEKRLFRENRGTRPQELPPVSKNALPRQESDSALQVGKARIRAERVELRLDGHLGDLRIPFRQGMLEILKSFCILSQVGINDGETVRTHIGFRRILPVLRELELLFPVAALAVRSQFPLQGAHFRKHILRLFADQEARFRFLGDCFLVPSEDGIKLSQTFMV